MELCMGTVQFGLDYGICGQRKPSIDDAVKCLDFAVQNGITAIDTAAAYGNAESVVGEFLKKKTIFREKLFLSTKLLPNILDDVDPEQYADIICENLKQSLKTLHTDYVDAYLLHSAKYAYDPQILEALKVAKKTGFAKHVGVSIYEPMEAFACIESPYVDFMQMPYSIFDHRMKTSGVFERAKNICNIHVRSAFIQGLIMMNEEQVPSFLEKAKPILRELDKVCYETGYSRVELAMAYVRREKTVSHLVFGVDNIEQLEQDICLFKTNISEELFVQMEEKFKNIETNIVMPSLWKK